MDQIRDENKIDFIEERPGVWSVAPESQQDMNDQIEAALRAAGMPSLEDLRNGS